MKSVSIANRRQFLSAVGVAAACPLVCSSTNSLLSQETPSVSPASDRILKTLKIGMVKGGNSFADKFRIAKNAGFDGIELNAPGIDVDDTKNAIVQSGLPVDGTVCATHWKIRHSSPDAEIRKQALRDLVIGIEQTAAVGGHSILLVVGHGDDGPESEITPRSIENIAQALPTAAKYGVDIVIENVWNHFLYDHEGPSNQSPDRFIKYIDAFASPWVGMQFDIGNHWQYADVAAWIRALNTRIMKLDIKGYSRALKAFSDNIVDGDIDWKSVRQALRDIRFYGWCAAEVRGGDEVALKEIAREMDLVLEQS